MAQNIVHEPALGQSAIASTEHATAGKKSGLAALAVGSMGVVYGDIGTSPLYALRESLVHVQSTGISNTTVLGTVSLLIWAFVPPPLGPPPPAPPGPQVRQGGGST